MSFCPPSSSSNDEIFAFRLRLHHSEKRKSTAKIFTEDSEIADYYIKFFAVSLIFV